MPRYSTTFILVAVYLLSAIGGCAGQQPAPDSSAFRSPVPGDLSAETQKVLKEIEQTRPVSADEKSRLRNVISDLNLSTSAKNADEESVIRAAGLPVIPIADAMLLSSDVATRQKAADGLCVLTVSLARTPDWEKGSRALLLISRRSLLDKDTTVRLYALSILEGVGFRSRDNLPTGLAAALEEAIQDPEARIRARAQSVKEFIGLAPRDPKAPIPN